MPLFDADTIIARKLDQYREARDGNEIERIELEADIKHYLEEAGVAFFDVAGRVKDPESFQKKVRKSPMRDVDDVLGFRIITYVESDIPAVETVLRRIFKVDNSSRVDKVTTRDPDSFGYRSLQFVASRWNLGYGSDPNDLHNMITNPDRFEIQIRTLLSHAWAKLDHERYKRRQTEPDLSRNAAGDREFALTAALLEQADRNLDRIARGNVDPLPESRDENLDPIRFIETNRFSARLDQSIFDALDLPVNHVILAERAIGRSAHVAGWRSNAEIEDAVSTHGTLAKRMAIVCTDVHHSQIHTDYDGYRDIPPVLFEGIGVYWLGLAVAYGVGLPEGLEYLKETELGIPAGRLAEYEVVARYLIDHPNEPALSVREKYWSVRAPFGSDSRKDYTPITLA